MKLTVSLGLWQDRPAEEALVTARAADELGYPELWVGEMATYDAFALATAIGSATSRIALTVGPLAVAVRDPMMIAMGAASVAGLTGRPVSVALGTSSPLVVERWHGRPHAGSTKALSEAVDALRPLLDGVKSDHPRSQGYRLRLPPPRSELTVAAFGPAAVRIAARADRMVLNLITPASAARLIADLRTLTTPETDGSRVLTAPEADGSRALTAREAEGSRTLTAPEAEGGNAKPGPRVAAWVTACADPDQAAIEQLRRAVVGYLAAPGYGEMFAEAGFGDIVDYARTRPHPRELLAAIPDKLLESVALLGDSIETRLAEYTAAGVDEIALVPVSTDNDPGGTQTLRTLAAYQNSKH
ncbi:LLM class F420-dependent oxidoreductase [Acrocarpospora phusangensis]|uniref:LLM class F420-dependent oxidoreductase n=1 Tax=Acrocarpospora phusangensis TaxID=1070424 RepID=A0A919US79_9ACTN|nr:LLM class F420-dependent oxidoreductase [Acrocarpospora phusangensis]GIH26195.1 LLM class F420-dependent oxidoreductase [Acrocarpospora phusangensis]